MIHHTVGLVSESYDEVVLQSHAHTITKFQIMSPSVANKLCNTINKAMKTIYYTEYIL